MPTNPSLLPFSETARRNFLHLKAMALLFMICAGVLGVTFMYFFVDKGWKDGWGFFLCGLFVFYMFGKFLRELYDVFQREKKWKEQDKHRLRFIVAEIEEEQCRAGKR